MKESTTYDLFYFYIINYYNLLGYKSILNLSKLRFYNLSFKDIFIQITEIIMCMMFIISIILPILSITLVLLTLSDSFVYVCYELYYLFIGILW